MTSEFELIRRYFTRPAPSARLGVGDDAALIAPGEGMELVATTDLLNEGVHFARGAEPRALGHKALAVNLSDLAAMGATPRWVLLALALPRAEERWVEAFAGGLFALAARHGVELVGGDTTRGPLAVCITALGEVPKGSALLRSGAQAGDDIWVSGELGGAALGLARPDLAAAARRLHQPEPRVELGVRLRGLASAAIDVSDGLAGDLGHILERSRVGARLEYARLPKAAALAELRDAALERRCVLAGGDDYELAFCAPRAARATLETLGRELGVALTRIGEIVAGEPRLVVVGPAGEAMPVGSGFDHFAP